MASELISYEDLVKVIPDLGVDEAEIYIELAEARARFEAPCVDDAGFPYGDMVRAVLVSTILKWHHNGPGAATTTNYSAGPFAMGNTVDTRVVSGYTLANADKRDLRALCQRWRGDGSARRRVFSYVPGRGVRQ